MANRADIVRLVADAGLGECECPGHPIGDMLEILWRAWRGRPSRPVPDESAAQLSDALAGLSYPYPGVPTTIYHEIEAITRSRAWDIIEEMIDCLNRADYRHRNQRSLET